MEYIKYPERPQPKNIRTICKCGHDSNIHETRMIDAFLDWRYHGGKCEKCMCSKLDVIKEEEW